MTFTEQAFLNEATQELLQHNSLPADDISEKTRFFTLATEDGLSGMIGWEIHGNHALLRSLAVPASARGKGYGSLLVAHLEAHICSLNVTELYLLTTTAEAFFTGRNYQVISRSDVPEIMLEASEFTTACPASAIVMKKTLV
ncbi:MAG TPA: arsenic resistance N-acetyltransferase ArsN2 [Flavisolibacter sp.]